MIVRHENTEWVDRATQKVGSVLRWFYTMRRRLATAGVGALAVWLAIHVTMGQNGTVAYAHKRAESRALEKDIQQLQQENDALTQHIKSLKSDPETIERVARQELHYTRPGEVVYVMPSPAAPKPTESTASKH